MEIPISKYQNNSLYVLSNQYYIDLIEKKGKPTIMAIKSPEAAILRQSEISKRIVSNSQKLKEKLNSEITNLSIELNVDNLTISNIIPKAPLPVVEGTNSIKIIGVFVDKKGNPLPKVEISPIIFFTPPDIEPFLTNDGETIVNSVGELVENQTDFSTQVFTLPEMSLPYKAPVQFTNQEGKFVFEYITDESIDFSKTRLLAAKKDYIPKDIGPNLGKSGEEFVVNKKALNESPPESKFEGPTQTIDTKLILQEDGKYRAEIDLEALELDKVVKGIGVSQDREIAKKKARNNAEQKLAKEAEGRGSDTSSPQQGEDKIKLDVYDIGRITLISTKIDIEEKKVEAQVKIQEAENEILERQTILGMPFELKFSSLQNFFKEKIKRILIPYVLDLLSKFGPNVLANILGAKSNILEDRICLPKDQLLVILEKRNKLTRQINNLYRTVKSISKILKVTEGLIFGFQLVIKVATLTSTPVTFSAQVNEGIKIAERALRKARPTVTSLSITAASIGFLLGFVLELLKQLDALLQNCAEQVDPETGEFVLSFEEIDKEINNFKDPTSEEEQESIIDPLTGKPFPYKGFTFEIKNDTSQNFQYPKRYAIARNVQGIQVLRSESSFASNPSVLIEELKFAIDRDNLRAD